MNQLLTHYLAECFHTRMNWLVSNNIVSMEYKEAMEWHERIAELEQELAGVKGELDLYKAGVDREERVKLLNENAALKQQLLTIERKTLERDDLVKGYIEDALELHNSGALPMTVMDLMNKAIEEIK
jgi:hypothetical protein